MSICKGTFAQGGKLSHRHAEPEALTGGGDGSGRGHNTAGCPADAESAQRLPGAAAGARTGSGTGACTGAATGASTGPGAGTGSESADRAGPGAGGSARAPALYAGRGAGVGALRSAGACATDAGSGPGAGAPRAAWRAPGAGAAARADTPDIVTQALSAEHSHAHLSARDICTGDTLGRAGGYPASWIARGASLARGKPV